MASRMGALLVVVLLTVQHESPVSGVEEHRLLRLGVGPAAENDSWSASPTQSPRRDEDAAPPSRDPVRAPGRVRGGGRMFAPREQAGDPASERRPTQGADRRGPTPGCWAVSSSPPWPWCWWVSSTSWRGFRAVPEGDHLVDPGLLFPFDLTAWGVVHLVIGVLLIAVFHRPYRATVGPVRRDRLRDDQRCRELPVPRVSARHRGPPSPRPNYSFRRPARRSRRTGR